MVPDIVLRHMALLHVRAFPTSPPDPSRQQPQLQETPSRSGVLQPTAGKQPPEASRCSSRYRRTARSSTAATWRRSPRQLLQQGTQTTPSRQQGPIKYARVRTTTLPGPLSPPRAITTTTAARGLMWLWLRRLSRLSRVLSHRLLLNRDRASRIARTPQEARRVLIPGALQTGRTLGLPRP